MPATFDLTGDRAIQQGADYALSLNLTTSTSAPLNLTGYTIASQIRANHNSAILASFTVSTTGTTGTVSMSLSNAVTAALPPTSGGIYYGYDVLMTDSAGIKTRILAGAVEVDASITQ